MAQKLSELDLSRREGWEEAACQMLQPILSGIEAGWSRAMPPGGLCARPRPSARRLEYELRPLWMAGPLLAGFSREVMVELGSGKKVEAGAFLREMMIEGVTPGPNAWVRPSGSMDQRLVESASLAVSLVIARETLWDKLPKASQEELFRWFEEGLGTFDLSINNWNLFVVLIELAKWQLGLPHDWAQIDGLLDEIEKMYHSDGWYADGYYRQFDYYVPWAIQYYLVMAAGWLRDERPEFAACIFERARAYAADFEWYFDSLGRQIPYGRSLTYRFAASSFWSVCAWACVPGLDAARCRRLAAENVAWFLQQDIFQPSGVLSVGYAYPNAEIAELYISDASPMWAFKTFLLLATPADHPAWEGESPSPALADGTNILEPLHCIVTRGEEGRHAVFYNGGSFHPFDLGNHPAKYGKFAYSSHFGFNLADGTQPSLDNMICLSPDGQVWSHRREFEIMLPSREVLVSKHRPFAWDEQTIITTALLVSGPWHVRLHWMRLAREYQVREAAFPVSVETVEMFEPFTHRQSDGIIFRTELGSSAIFGEENSAYGLSERQPHVNVIWRNVVMPSREAMLGAGDYCWGTAVFGATGAVPEKEILAGRPRIHWTKSGLAQVTWPGKAMVEVPLAEPVGPLRIVKGGGIAWPVAADSPRAK